MTCRRKKRVIGSGEVTPLEYAIEHGGVEADPSQQVQDS
jgi:hypothetical protein